MITWVLLLLLPWVLVMCLYRLVQIPRDLLARRLRLQPRRPLLAATALVIAYSLAAVCTARVLWVLVRAIGYPPTMLAEVFDIGRTLLALPLGYLCFEWTLYHCVKAVAQAPAPHSSPDRDDGR